MDNMRPKARRDSTAAELPPDSAQLTEPVEQCDCPDEDGYIPDELGVVPMASAPPLPAALANRLAAIEAQLAEMARQLAGESARALARERVIDRQHAEIERLKAIERAGQLRPVVTDLCRLRNGLIRQAETVPAEMTGRQIASLLQSFAATVEEMLERCGVTVLPQGVGVDFAASRQQVAAVVEINDPERDGTVAEVVQDGYAENDGGKVVVPARVKVHRYVTKEKMDG
jgi:molecular chaperone GrpE (heat shock protein)